MSYKFLGICQVYHFYFVLSISHFLNQALDKYFYVVKSLFFLVNQTHPKFYVKWIFTYKLTTKIILRKLFFILTIHFLKI